MLKGNTEPRLFTRPNRALTPETSLGFAVIEFASAECGVELLPWQKWLLVHALELNPDGTFRFRRVIVPVARQNGKTTLLKVLAAYVMQANPGKTVLGVAQDLSVAKESWTGVVDLYETFLPDRMAAKNAVRRSTGDLQLTLANRSRYRICAANGKAGRGLPVNLLVLDELREMKSWDPYQALAPTTTAQSDGMVVCISNAGGSDSVVFNGLRDTALAGTEDAIGLFEWSAPEGCDLDDPEAWAAANPGLGITVQESELRVALATFPPNQYRTEHLCQRVDTVDTALDLAAWQDCADSQGNLEAVRDRVALCLDVSPDMKHISLVAAAVRSDGRVGVEPVAAWESTAKARQELPDLVARIAPRVFGYFPSGPAAGLVADLRSVKKAVEIKSGEVTAVCMGLAEQIASRRILHGNDPLLNAHVSQATQIPVGDGWRFSRKDGGHVDAVYAAAGAVHLARTLPDDIGKPRILIAS